MGFTVFFKNPYTWSFISTYDWFWGPDFVYGKNQIHHLAIDPFKC